MRFKTPILSFRKHYMQNDWRLEPVWASFMAVHRESPCLRLDYWYSFAILDSLIKRMVNNRMFTSTTAWQKRDSDSDDFCEKLLASDSHCLMTDWLIWLNKKQLTSFEKGQQITKLNREKPCTLNTRYRSWNEIYLLQSVWTELLVRRLKGYFTPNT